MILNGFAAAGTEYIVLKMSTARLTAVQTREKEA